MNVAIEPGNERDLPLFRRLMQLYLYDFSEFAPLFLNQQGLFEQRILEDYFHTATKTPFLVKVDGLIAGFVLVNSEPLLVANKDGKRLKEFFVLRGFRRNGVGLQAATAVFNRFRGRWEVGVVVTNKPAQMFWQSTIDHYTNGNFQLVTRNDEQWNGLIFSFDTPG